MGADDFMKGPHHVRLLIQPILKSEAWHLREVALVSREQGGIVRQSNGCDFEILGSNTRAIFEQAFKNKGGFLIPWQDGPLGV